MRTIDADAMKDWLEIVPLTDDGGVDINDLEEYINEQPTVPQWIPCSERMPEKCKEVLVCYDFKGHRSVLIGTLYGDESFHGYDDEYLTIEGRRYRKAVAWMPLPEPYREKYNERT